MGPHISIIYLFFFFKSQFCVKGRYVGSTLCLTDIQSAYLNFKFSFSSSIDPISHLELLPILCCLRSVVAEIAGSRLQVATTQF